MEIAQNSNLKTQSDNSKLKSNNVKLRAYKLSLDTIAFVNLLPNKRAFWVISDQLLRSVTSIGANLVEAQAASSRRDFIKFYEIALKSSNESKYWFSLLKDSHIPLNNKVAGLLLEVDEISKMIGSSVITLKGKRKI